MIRKQTRQIKAKQAEPTEKLYLHSVVWSQSTITEHSTLKDVAKAIHDLIKANGVHTVQISVFKGSRVKVLFSGDPITPSVRLMDGDKSMDVVDTTDFTESVDGWLFSQDSQTDAGGSSENSSSSEFGAFDFGS